ncbi:uncharacterized protein BCR38DRAFT_485848 [Pseudomassariella vexata]|uniref:Uncharacterized protein n=1 Tax=Pseudomassariella vexata TaxID=1141098 RepID=A0A1Y2DV61_9PEZI|nr:uncharacterized protein BCR38DRAFT_485848 [Pseudomassariella vexata]ORY63079.1 hypothetical protein BCR38DRAFT_485848 [Pseudomassariella vexata]
MAPSTSSKSSRSSRSSRLSRRSKTPRTLSMTEKNIQRRQMYRNRNPESKRREAFRLKRQHTIYQGKILMQCTAWSLLKQEQQISLLCQVEEEIRELFAFFVQNTEEYEGPEDVPGPKLIAQEAVKKVLGDNTHLFGFGADESVPSELTEWI